MPKRWRLELQKTLEGSYAGFFAEIAFEGKTDLSQTLYPIEGIDKNDDAVAFFNANYSSLLEQLKGFNSEHENILIQKNTEIAALKEALKEAEAFINEL